MKQQPNFSQKSQVHTSIWGTQGIQNKVGGGDLVFWSEKWPFETIIEKTIWRPTEDSGMSAQHVGIDKNWRIICLLKINQDFEPILKIYVLFEKYQRLEKKFSM